jgi:hypothetical protein
VLAPKESPRAAEEAAKAEAAKAEGVPGAPGPVETASTAVE